MKMPSRAMLFISLVTTSVLCCTGCFSARAFQAQTSSPGGTYTINFVESTESQPGLMFDNRVVTFSLFKHGKRVLNQELFSRNKDDKPLFAQMYPKQNWVAENILRLGDERLPEPSCDEIIVSNLTDKQIIYFDVITFLPERFIIFDLPSNSTIKLYARPENNASFSNETFMLSGKYSDGTQINVKEITFNLRSGSNNNAHFCIIVTDEGVSMTSSEYEWRTYNFDETVKALRGARTGNLSPESIPKPKEALIPRSYCKSK